MSTLFNNGHNPDVLECLANLSNDEVFTSVKLANDKLDKLPQDLFKNKYTKFLEPCCKTGVYLREIAKRLIEGLKDEIPDLQERVNWIMKNQLFGIAITELTALMTRRTLYCSKDVTGEFSIASCFDRDWGNILYDPDLKHTFENGKCKYCGASESEYNGEKHTESYAYWFIHHENVDELKNKLMEEFGTMEFDVIIGNPPYQLKVAENKDRGKSGNGTKATPLYQEFFKMAEQLALDNGRYISFIIPSRWMNGEDPLLKEFRKNTIKKKNFKYLVDFVDAGECFPNVEIKGGVQYFLYDKLYNGKTKVTVNYNGKSESCERYLLENGVDDYIRFNRAHSILNKVRAHTKNTLNSIVGTQLPFGIESNFTNYTDKYFDGAVTLIIKGNQKVYIKKSEITKNQELLTKKKILFPKIFGNGFYSDDTLRPIIALENECCTRTYLVVDNNFKTLEECNSFISYINTKFVHFLFGLIKNTQQASRDIYKFVPLLDKYDHIYTDDELYKLFGLSVDEIKYIEDTVWVKREETK